MPEPTHSPLLLPKSLPPDQALRAFFDGFQNVSGAEQNNLIELATSQLDARPSGQHATIKTELQEWAIKCYQIAGMLAIAGRPHEAFVYMEQHPWQGANFSAIASWGVPSVVDQVVVERILEKNSPGLSDTIALTLGDFATLTVQHAFHLSRIPNNLSDSAVFASIEAKFQQATEIFCGDEAPSGARAAWTLRQHALALKRRYDGSYEATALDRAVPIIQRSYEVADSWRGPLDPVRGADHRWHSYGSRNTHADLLVALAERDLHDNKQAFLEQMRKIGAMYFENEICFAARDFRAGCGKPGHDINSFSFRLAELQEQADNRTEACKLLFDIEMRAARSLMLDEKHYAGWPRALSSGWAYMDWGWAIFKLGCIRNEKSREEALEYLRLATTLLNETEHPHDHTEASRRYTTAQAQMPPT